MKRPLKTVLMVGVPSFLILGTGVIIYHATLPLGISYAATSQQLTHAQKTRSFYRGRIQSVSSSTVTIDRTHDKQTSSQTLPLNHVTVQAGWYHLPSQTLQPQEAVSVNQTGASAWTLSLHPVAHGKLELTNGQWMVHKKTIGGHPVMEGLSQMSAGVPVVVYGTRNGSQIAAQVVQLRPKMVVGTVIQNSSGNLSVSTKKVGHLQYSYLRAPNASQLEKISLGNKVRMGTNPSTHQVLFARPIHRMHWGKIAKTLTHNVYGKLTQSSPSSLTIQGKWGSQQVNLNTKRVKVVWQKHSKPSLSQIPAGSMVMLRQSRHQWILHVMPTHS